MDTSADTDKENLIKVAECVINVDMFIVAIACCIYCLTQINMFMFVVQDCDNPLQPTSARQTKRPLRQTVSFILCPYNLFYIPMTQPLYIKSCV